MKLSNDKFSFIVFCCHYFVCKVLIYKLKFNVKCSVFSILSIIGFLFKIFYICEGLILVVMLFLLTIFKNHLIPPLCWMYGRNVLLFHVGKFCSTSSQLKTSGRNYSRNHSWELLLLKVLLFRGQIQFFNHMFFSNLPLFLFLANKYQLCVGLSCFMSQQWPSFQVINITF